MPLDEMRVEGSLPELLLVSEGKEKVVESEGVNLGQDRVSFTCFFMYI